jgi:glycerol dehydrogenase
MPTVERTQLAIYCGPERYVQGRDATQALAQQLEAVAVPKGPVLIVASPSPRRLLEDIWRRVLPPAGYEPIILDFHGRCTARVVDDIAALASRHRAVAILAAGGGQVIDAARAASDLGARSDNPNPAANPNSDLRKAQLTPLPFISCPTVASTDAPCSAVSVIYDDKGAVESYRFFRRHPVLVLVDTAAVARSPRRMLVGGLGDALATWYEARSVSEAGERGRNFFGGRPTPTGLAIAKVCRDALFADGVAALASVDAKAVTPALERVVEACTLGSGLGFENGGIATAHACHNGLTTCERCCERHSHGERVAFGLCTQLALEGRVGDELTQIHKFCHAVGLPITLKGVSVDGADNDLVRQIAERTVLPHESAHNSAELVDAARMADAIRLADRLGVMFEERRA